MKLGLLTLKMLACMKSNYIPRLWVAEGFAMNDLSSLVEASIEIEFCHEQDGSRFDTSMAEFVHGISNVQTLNFSGESFKVIFLPAVQ